MRKKYLRSISALMALTVLVTQSNITAFAEDNVGDDALLDAEEEITWEEGEDFTIRDEESFYNYDEEAYQESENSDDTTVVRNTSDEAYVISEIIDAREEYSKEYLLSDDSRAVYYYAEPVHFEAEDGSWQEIDNTILQTENGYENSANSYHVLFTDSEESQGEVLFEEDGYKVDFSYVDDTNDPVTDSDPDEYLNSSMIMEQSDLDTDLFSLDNNENKLTVSLTLDDSSFSDAAITESTLDDKHEDEDTTESDEKDLLNESADNHSEPFIVPSSTITYDGYNNDVSLEYSPSSTGVKENIVLESAEAGSNFTFRVKLEGLKARVSSANEVELYDENTDEIKYYFPAPFMEDKEGRYSDEVWYSLSETCPYEDVTDSDDAIDQNVPDEDDIAVESEEIAEDTENSDEVIIESETGETLEILEEEEAETTNTDENCKNADIELLDEDFIYLTLTADEEFLSTASYPVVIDPVIKQYKSESNVVGVCYRNDKKSETDTLYVGNKDGENYVTCIRFDLPYVSPGAVITGAQLYLSGTASASNKNYIVARKITSSWTDGGDVSEVQPSVDDRIIDFSVAGGCFNITKPVREWIYGKCDNNGLAFMTYKENATKRDSIKLLGGNKKPFFKLSYKNTFGLESYWSTHDVAAGTAGCGYINDYTGAVTVVNTASHTEGLRMPFSIQNVYNSNLERGDRWHLNYDQRIVIPSDEVDVSEYPYVYIDEDQTKHYFKAKNVTYLENGVKATAQKTGTYPAAEDEDGLKLYIVPVKDKELKEQYPLKLINKSSSIVKYFDKNGYLALIRDSNKFENGKNPKDKNNKEVERENNEIKIALESTASASETPSGYGELKENIDRIKTLSGGKEKLSVISEELNALLDRSITAADELCTEERAKTDIRVAIKLQEIRRKLRRQKEYLREKKRSDLTASTSSTLKIAENAEELAEEDKPVRCHITSITDAALHTAELTYDDYGRLKQITDPSREDGKAIYHYDDANGISNDVSLIEFKYINRLKDEAPTLVTKTAAYGYDNDENGQLNFMQDNSGYRVCFSNKAGRVIEVSEEVVKEGKTLKGQTYSIDYGDNNTVTYHFSGIDDEYGSTDDIFNTEVFDERGRVVSVYSKNSSDEILGANAVTFSDDVKYYAKTSSNDQSETGTINLIENSGFEDDSESWHVPDALHEKVNLLDKERVYLGDNAASITLGPNDEVAFFYQIRELKAGTYTLSYRVHASSQMKAGAIIYQEYHENPEESEILARKDEDGFVLAYQSITLDEDATIYIYMCGSGEGTAYFDNVQLEKGDKPTSYSYTETASSSASQGNEDADESVRNKIKDYAVTGRITHNYLLNHSFERKGCWEGEGEIKSLQNPFIGVHALVFDATMLKETQKSESQTVRNLKSGKYTLSAYVRGTDLNGAKGWLSVQEDNGDMHESETITETTSKKIGDGWERLSVSFETDHEQDITVSVNAAGTAEKPAGKLVFDCLQLEDGDLANDYNILEDGNFDNPGGSLPDIWKNLKNVALSDEIATEGGIDGKNCYHIKGEPGKNKYLNCTVNLGNKTASYVLSGFIKTNTTPVRNKRELSVRASHEIDNQVLRATLKLDEFSEGWKYFTLILPAHKWGKTTVSINFFDNIGDLYIDGLELRKVNIQSKKFDKEGRVLGSCVSEKQTSYGYDSYDRMNKMVSAGGVTYSYTYDSTNNNTSVKADVGPSTYMTYDKYGNQESVSTHVPITRDEEGNATNKPLELHTSAEYTEDGNFLKSQKDEAGVTTTYEYDTTRGILLSEEQAGYNADVAIEDLDTGIIDKIKNTVSGWFSADDGKNDRIEVAYGYDDDKLISVSKTGDNETRSIDYSYTEGGDIESITHHDFAYTYEYDDFGNLTKTYIAGQEVLTNEYNGNNGSLKYTKYADERQTYKEYDDYGNIIEAGIKKGEDKLRYDNYEYYNDGNLAHHSDTKAGIETTFEYGDTGKVTKSSVTGSAEDIDYYSRLSYIYNTLGKVENLNIEIKEGDKKKVDSYKYTYAKDGKNAVDTFPDGSSKKFGYDSLRRTASTVYSPKENADASKKLYSNISYCTAEPSSKSYKGTQNRVGEYQNSIGSTSKTIDSCFEYTYDDRGNICGINEEYDVKRNRTVNTIPGQYTRGYVYDAFGEVVKAKESYKSGQTKTYYYTYDDGGNITDEFIKDPDANDVIQNRYEYDPVWKDQLKKYNGKTIDYDKCGNPKKYLDYTMTWDTTNGSLTFVNANGKDCNYTYLSDGQRISKDVGGEKTAYIYNAGMLLYEETTDYRLNFYYDADGLVTEIGYQTKDNGSYSDETRYFYSRNGQGDIIAIYRCKDSTLVGTYEYDLWGNPVSQNENVFTKKVNGKTVTITDEQGILGKNPLRYRGYYYDKETGFYYLNARYYDPIVHRFISVDSASNLGAEGEITSYNLYAYCGNDPINRYDKRGSTWETVWEIVVAVCEMSSVDLVECGAIALFDTAALGPADVVAAILFTGAVIDNISTAISMTKDISEEKIDVTAIVLEAGKNNNEIYIFRYFGTDISNLVPRQVDVDDGTGLSFRLIPRNNSWVTTVSMVNQTGVLLADVNGKNHVSIYPLGGTLQDWINQGESSIWTIALLSVCRKIK